MKKLNYKKIILVFALSLPVLSVSINSCAKKENINNANETEVANLGNQETSKPTDNQESNEPTNNKDTIDNQESTKTTDNKEPTDNQETTGPTDNQEPNKPTGNKEPTDNQEPTKPTDNKEPTEPTYKIYTKEEIKRIVENNIDIKYLEKPSINNNSIKQITELIENNEIKKPIDLLKKYEPKSDQKYYEFISWIDISNNKVINDETEWKNLYSNWDYKEEYRSKLEENLKEDENKSKEYLNKRDFIDGIDFEKRKEQVKEINIYMMRNAQSTKISPDKMRRLIDKTEKLIQSSVEIFNEQIKSISNDPNKPFAKIIFTVYDEPQTIQNHYKVQHITKDSIGITCQGLGLACVNTDDWRGRNNLLITDTFLYEGTMYANEAKDTEVDMNSFYQLGNDDDKLVLQQEILIHEFGHILGLDDKYNEDRYEAARKYKNIQSTYYSHFSFNNKTDSLISTKPGLKENDLRALKRVYVD